MDLQEAIREITAREGIEILKNAEKFHAILSDLSPEYPKERKIFRAFLDGNILSQFIITDKSKCNVSLSKIRIELLDKGMSEEWIKVIMESIASPLGWEEEVVFFLQQNFSNQTNQSKESSTTLFTQEEDNAGNTEVESNEMASDSLNNINHVIQSTISPADNIVNLGIMSLAAGDNNKAISQFERALEIDGNCLGGYLGLSSILDLTKSEPYVKRLLGYRENDIRQFLQNSNIKKCSQLVDNMIRWGNPSLVEMLVGMGWIPTGNSYYYVVRSEKWKELIHIFIKYKLDLTKRYEMFRNRDGSYKNYERRTLLNDVFLYRRDIDCCKELINSGADVDYGCEKIRIDRAGNRKIRYIPMLAIVCYHEADDLVELLLAKGADANRGGDDFYFGDEIQKYSILHSVIIWNKNTRKYVDILLKYGVDPNYEYLIYPQYYNTDRNLTCYTWRQQVGLMDAILYGDNQILEKMLKAGANPNATFTCNPYDTDNGWQADDYIIEVPILDIAIRRNNREAIQMLVDAGASFKQLCGKKFEKFPLSSRDYGKGIDKDTKQLIRKLGWRGSSLFKDTYIWYPI